MDALISTEESTNQSRSRRMDFTGFAPGSSDAFVARSSTPQRRGVVVHDAVVIGGGLAGLVAARALTAAGADVLVLEAQERVGGRTLTIDLGDGLFIDHGGQWISPGQDRIVALAKELGVNLFPSWSAGKTVLWRKGRRSTYATLFPPEDAAAETEARGAASSLATMAATIPLDTPWTAPDAAAWDNQTLSEWLAANVASVAARSALAAAFTGVFSEGPGQPSLLAALFWAKSGDPLVPFLPDPPAEPERRFVGGAQQLSRRMAAALGDRIRLGVWAPLIEHDPQGVRIHTGTETVSAQRAIVAMAPAIAGRIRFVPALGVNRDQLTQRAPMGWIIKVHAVYPTRFWRDADLAGTVSSDAGAVKISADNSPPSGSPGILVGFIQGAAARRLAPATFATRRDAVLADFVRYFGADAANPRSYHEHDWGGDEFTRGAEGGYWTRGIWTAYGSTLREPIGPLHWAGTETSPIWNGKMEGAVRSGERAAAEVLRALR